ncbi:glycosyltransferase [Longilinea arvoryzae]|uniref:Glycosyltransferase n=1 Tax=Longilinea arvoryzae TaxID=360412 RepID=A0A0S7BHB3_9CHLR|nr:glycosyltransferase [Longilinea arvoryzae]GAP13474.1 glycosyltransferase [Longilinea arvoryzae]
MQILFLSRWYPYPANNGSKLRIWNLLRALGRRHTVTLVSFVDPAEGTPDLEGLRGIVSEVHTVPWREFDPGSLRALVGFFALAPRWMVDTFSPQMAETIRRVLHSQKYDLVIASQVVMGAYAGHFENVPAILEEVELGVYFQKQERAVSAFRKIRHSLTLFKLRLYLRNLLKRFSGYTVVSEREKGLLEGMVSGSERVRIIPNCVELEDYRDIRMPKRENSLIYAGSFRYDVNYEAMQWFVGEVFPRILAEIPTAQLTITGDPAGKRIEPRTHVMQVGLVPDVRPVVASSMISLAPLQTGGGTRLKILEAMALRSPVVSTSKGAEGLEVRAGEHLLVADSPQDFAAAVIRLLKDETLRESITEAGYRLVEEKYSWQKALIFFLKWIETIPTGSLSGISQLETRHVDDDEKN